LTGISFVEDGISPDIAIVADSMPANSPRIVIRDGKTFVGQGDSLAAALESDPIAEISRRLCLTLKTGPYAATKIAPSPSTEPTLSEIISGFLKVLHAADLTGDDAGVKFHLEGARFKVAVTHDIDIVRRSIRGSVRLLFNRHVPGGLGGLADAVRATLRGSPNPYDRIGEWLQSESRLGLESTWFAFAGPRQHKSDPVYELDAIAKDLKAISTCDAELALHSGIGCFAGRELGRSKADLEGAAGAVVSGVRPHYLSAFYPDYWSAAAREGFAYSSGLGFDEAIGFVDGVDLPILPFDRAADRPIGIVEIPIAIMDCGLVATGADALNHGRALIERCAKNGSVVVLDWHERTLYQRDYPGWAGLFIELIDHARSLGAHFATMSEIARTIRQRYEECS
jgi:hypothetical protein